MSGALNNTQLCEDLRKALPASVFAKIESVYGRIHWPHVDVWFDNSHQLRIRKADWLNAAAIARICLECP